MIDHAEAAMAVYEMDFHPSYEWLRSDPAFIDHIAARARYNPSVILPDKANPIAVLGVAHSFGSGEAFMVTSKEFKGKAAYMILQQTKQLLQTSIKLFSLHRLHMAVDPAHEGARDWAEAAGFVFDVPYRNGGVFGQDLELWVFQHKEEVDDGRN